MKTSVVLLCKIFLPRFMIIFGSCFTASNVVISVLTVAVMPAVFAQDLKDAQDDQEQQEQLGAQQFEYQEELDDQ